MVVWSAHYVAPADRATECAASVASLAGGVEARGHNDAGVTVSGAGVVRYAIEVCLPAIKPSGKPVPCNHKLRGLKGVVFLGWRFIFSYSLLKIGKPSNVCGSALGVIEGIAVVPWN